MITRRSFIRDGAAMVALGGAVPNVFGKAIREADLDRGRSSRAGKDRLLLVVQLEGGNDGLNTVIPYGDGAYRSLRKGIGIPEGEIVRLDGRIGLPPALKPLKQFWDRGSMAIVEGVGYENHSQSHFEAMNAWQTANPEGVSRGGWLGRYLDDLEKAEHDPLYGFNVGTPLAPELTTGDTSVPAVDDPGSYGLQLTSDDEPEERKATLLKLYESFAPDSFGGALLETTLGDALSTASILRETADAYVPARPYPEESFAGGMKLTAAMTVARPGLRVAHVSLGGFDTHSAQQGAHGQLMAELAGGIEAFLLDMEAKGRGDDVVVMTWSEFGRRPGQNDTSGTDHGAAAPMLLFGNALRGGFYGEPAPLSRLDDDGNLRVTTDFRRVYATLLERWLEVEAAPILDGRWEPLPFL